MYCTYCYPVLAAVLGIQFCAAQTPEPAPSLATNIPVSTIPELSLSPSAASQAAPKPNLVPANLAGSPLPPAALLSLYPPIAHRRPPGPAQPLPITIRPSAALLSTDTRHQVTPCIAPPAPSR